MQSIRKFAKKFLILLVVPDPRMRAAEDRLQRLAGIYDFELAGQRAGLRNPVSTSISSGLISCSLWMHLPPEKWML
jgi:hypothetical protein